MPTLRGYWNFARVALPAGPAIAAATVASTIIAAFAPLAGVAATGLLIGQIPKVIRSGLNSPAGTSALLLAVATTALFALQWAAASLQTVAATALGDRVDFMLQRRLMAEVMSPVGVAHLEDAATVDLITVGRETFRAWLRPGRLAPNLSQLVSARLLLLGACLIVARFSWLLALVLLAAAIWAEYEGQLASRKAAEHHYGGNVLVRRIEYLYDLGVTPSAAKEIRVFGWPGFLVGRFAETWQQAMGLALSKGSRRALVSTVVLIAVALAGAAWLSVDAAYGRLGISSITVYAQAIMLSLAGVGAAARARLESEMSLGALGRYEAAVRAVRPPADEAAGGRPADGLPQDRIRFENVTFRYPGSNRDALHGLDLDVPAGQSLAIVGANGAGKTTLVKLLCRLYEPDSGRIAIDAANLADLDVASWRQRIAPVFQDYVHYEMSSRSNIGMGFAKAQDDLTGIQAAAEHAGVSAAIARLPHGWDTVLSADYQDGTDLSGGEWQKIALARALFAIRHGATVLILDEPAANLDARAEAQLYEHFLSLTEGITTIVISHRFSTVRQATSIAVLREGRVAEQGCHDELLALGGHYAEMFLAQASRFGDPLATDRLARL